MRNIKKRAIALCFAAMVFGVHWADAAGNSWNKIRFIGGTIQAKVNRFYWNTTLTVNPDALVLMFAPRQTVSIKPSQVTSISYGSEAFRRVAGIVSAGNPADPQFASGKPTPADHYVGIVFQAEDGKPGAILLEPLKGICLDILQALKAATGKPIEML
jgi:hypothetical protein